MTNPMPEIPDPDAIQDAVDENFDNLDVRAAALVSAAQDMQADIRMARANITQAITAYQNELRLARNAVRNWALRLGTNPRQADVDAVLDASDEVDELQREGQLAAAEGDVARTNNVAERLRVIAETDPGAPVQPAPAVVPEPTPEPEPEPEPVATPAPVRTVAARYGEPGWVPVWWTTDFHNPPGETRWEQDVERGLTGHDHLLQFLLRALEQVIAFLGGSMDDEGNVTFANTTFNQGSNRDLWIRVLKRIGLIGLGVFVVALLIFWLIVGAQFGTSVIWSVILGLGLGTLIGFATVGSQRSLRRRRVVTESETE